MPITRTAATLLALLALLAGATVTPAVAQRANWCEVQDIQGTALDKSPSIASVGTRCTSGDIRLTPC